MTESLQYGKYDVEDPSPGFTMGADTERPERCPDCLYGLFGCCIRGGGPCFIGKKEETKNE